MTLYKGEHSLFRKLAPKYRLNKAEYLQLYNLRPTSQVMLELIIEEVCLSTNPFFTSSCTRCVEEKFHVTYADELDFVGGHTIH